MPQNRPLISFDYAAKTVLRNPANFGILSGFLSELLNDIKKVYSIDIVYFDRSLYKAEQLGDIYPEYYLIEVKKFDEKIRTHFDEWVHFLKTDEVKPEFTTKGLAEAKEKLDYLKLSLEEQAEYDRKMDKRSSFKRVMHTAKLEGKDEGKTELKDEVLDLIAKGYTLDQIKNILEGNNNSPLGRGVKPSFGKIFAGLTGWDKKNRKSQKHP